jgi:hypothetical protein
MCGTVENLFLCIGSSNAFGNMLDPLALLTRHRATPLENTIALVRHFFDTGVVSSPAAKQITAVNASRCFTADAVARTERGQLWIRFAVVGTPIQVDQICLRHGSVDLVSRYELSLHLIALHFHFDCRVEFLF